MADEINHKNILEQCTICNEPISRSAQNTGATRVVPDGTEQEVMCADCIEYFTKVPPQTEKKSTANNSVDTNHAPPPPELSKSSVNEIDELEKSTVNSNHVPQAPSKPSKNENKIETCPLCDGEISKLDVTFQCDQHSEHVTCQDCIDDQTCPYCNAPVLERVATSKSPDFPIEKYTYVKKLGDSNRAGKTYLYELQHSEAAPDLPKEVIVKTLNKRPSDDNLVILSCGNHPRIVKVYGKCTVLGQFGIVMKGFDETLESYLEQIVLTTNQQMSIPEVKTILNQLAFALQFLYKKDLLHCGIRPENIFIRKHNNKVQAALIDIGVSRLIPRIHKDPWMAPEASASEKPFYGHAADVYGFGLISIYLRSWPTLPNEFSHSVELLQEAIGDETMFELISDCLQYKPKNRIRKKDLVSHLFFQTSKEEIDKFKDILDEKVNLKNQLAAMKRECDQMKSQSQEIDRLSVIDSKVQKLKRRTLDLLEEEEEPPEVPDNAGAKIEEQKEEQKEEQTISETPSRPLSRRNTKKFTKSRDSSTTRNESSRDNSVVRKDTPAIRDHSRTRIDSKREDTKSQNDSSRDTSITRQDSRKETVSNFKNDPNNNDSIPRKDLNKSENQQNDVKSKDNQDKNVNKNQTLSEKVDSKKPNSTNTENLKPSEKVVDSKQIQSDSRHTNGHDVKIDQNSVKLENQETEECIGNIDNEDEEGIAYNLTGKLKLLDDMIINETTQHEEQVSEISYEESLEDFNEEEDYIKFLQKENMSPMIPKPQTKNLPLPVVTCEWSNKRTASNLSTYLPGLGRYSRFLGRSKVKPDEELNLTLKFENVATKLPPKLQLEICDPDSGQVVYMKRQNIYYIKLQEKLATLDCDKNYVLKVTSIKDNITADEEVVIQKKDAERSQESAPMKAMKSTIDGKEVYLKQGISMEIAKKELFKGENLVAVKPFNPKSDEISCISYHDPPPVILVKAKPVKQPDVFKRIVSDGKERWINEEETETTKK